MTTILVLRVLTLPVSCGPQEKTLGIPHKACAVGRQLQWVVRLGVPCRPRVDASLLRSHPPGSLPPHNTPPHAAPLPTST
jgi:hypothetical protein